MKDIETLIFTPIATDLRAEFPGIFVTGEYTNKPSAFPHVSIEEVDNYTPEGYLDSSCEEKISSVTYKASVYSNKTVGKKTECRKILGFIDDRFIRMNFKRTSMTPVPNEADTSIYRLVAMYEAKTDGKTMYR